VSTIAGCRSQFFIAAINTNRCPFVVKSGRDGAHAYGTRNGNGETLAARFGASEDDAHAALSELTGRNRIEKVYPGKYAIVRWRERDESGEVAFE
jgi:hypothetical protein